MIDRSWIGREIGRSVLPIEEGRTRFFAKAIGQNDPTFAVEEAAGVAGHEGLPAPPTFLFAADLDSGATFRMLDEMGVSLGRVLHGEQGFEYHRPVVAGDRISVTSKVENIYEKKGGALEFIEVRSEARNAAGDLVVTMRSVTVVRN